MFAGLSQREMVYAHPMSSASQTEEYLPDPRWPLTMYFPSLKTSSSFTGRNFSASFADGDGRTSTLLSGEAFSLRAIPGGIIVSLLDFVNFRCLKMPIFAIEEEK